MYILFAIRSLVIMRGLSNFQLNILIVEELTLILTILALEEGCMEFFHVDVDSRANIGLILSVPECQDDRQHRGH